LSADAHSIPVLHPSRLRLDSPIRRSFRVVNDPTGPFVPARLRPRAGHGPARRFIVPTGRPRPERCRHAPDRKRASLSIRASDRASADQLTAARTRTSRSSTAVPNSSSDRTTGPRTRRSECPSCAPTVSRKPREGRDGVGLARIAVRLPDQREFRHVVIGRDEQCRPASLRILAGPSPGPSRVAAVDARRRGAGRATVPGERIRQVPRESSLRRPGEGPRAFAFRRASGDQHRLRLASCVREGRRASSRAIRVASQRHVVSFVNTTGNVRDGARRWPPPAPEPMFR
jgi:hypothetical protein